MISSTLTLGSSNVVERVLISSDGRLFFIQTANAGSYTIYAVVRYGGLRTVVYVDGSGVPVAATTTNETFSWALLDDDRTVCYYKTWSNAWHYNCAMFDANGTTVRAP